MLARSLCPWLSLSLALAACAGTASAPPVAPTARDAPPAGDPAIAWVSRARPRRFGPGAGAPDGCFAWSVERTSAACALGQWPHRRASQPRVVSFLAASGTEPVPLPLQLTGEDPELTRPPGIAVTSRNRLDVAMREGSFVELPPSVSVARNAPPRAVGPFTLAMRHGPARKGEVGASSSTYATIVTVRLAGAEPPLLEESFGPSACADPKLEVFALSASVVLVQRACLLASEGGSDRHVAAWICDGARRVCR